MSLRVIPENVRKANVWNWASFPKSLLLQVARQA